MTVVMPQVDLDQEILDYLKSQVRDFGESPSSVLRKLLGLQGPPIPDATAPRIRTSPGVNHGSTAISRYLAILSDLYREYPDRFSRVDEVKGRKRIYFSRSSTLIEASGNSVMPERIPETPYFAATNLSDDKKKHILLDVLLKLGVG